VSRRHTAALALVGWYLMVPPRVIRPQAPGQQTFDYGAPLSRWVVSSAYDTAHECEGARFLNRQGHRQNTDPLKAEFDAAQCIATDDPRLKEK
jgi:hypothetical protein